MRRVTLALANGSRRSQPAARVLDRTAARQRSKHAPLRRPNAFEAERA
jgi:hypothetical protein